MRRINYSLGIDYHSQRNNVLVPYSSCNTTSMIMALKQAHWTLPIDRTYSQPEDALTAFLRTPDAYDKQRELAPWSVTAHPPQEVHAVLEWGVNAWLGHEVDRFVLDARSPDLRNTLDSGGGAVLSGRFPLPRGELGHIVSLAGYVLEEETVTDWIIDDPYGDWHSQYRDSHGNDCDLSLAEFKTIFDRRGDGCYWAHVIRSA